MFKVHKVEWNQNNISNFWDATSDLRDKQLDGNYYWSEIHGKPLIKFLKKHIRFQNKNYLDYGCGTGYLMHYVLSHCKKTKVYGLDLSQESIKIARNRNKSYENFMDVQCLTSSLSYQDNFFDVISCVEVIEHLNDEALQEMIKRCYDLLKVGGYLVITTPNQENLAKSNVICPECGCLFHRVQHLRTWDKNTLSMYLKDKFQDVKKIETVLFYGNSFMNELIRFPYQLLQKKLPNLVYIGRKYM